ncbi:MAG: hypothetical protein ACW97A_03500 [Candidatus Thorarchaeota archaeon]
MVRQLALDFLYRKKETRIESESGGVALAVAFAMAESRKKASARISSLSQVAVPFWVVQVSQNDSIVLAEAGHSEQVFEFTENRQLAEIRRILSSEIAEAKNIPEAVDRVMPLVKDVKPTTSRLMNIIEPNSISAIGRFVVELEPTSELNRLQSKIDSQAALRTSEDFQNLRDSARTRVESMEELRKHTSETLRSQLTVLENIILKEKERWEQRASLMQDRTEQETQDLTRKKQDELYHLKDKHKMSMRAVTADFARAISDVERFFNDMLDKIRDVRVEIGRRGDDVEGAVSEYRELTNYLSSTVPQFTDTLETMNAKSDEVLKDMTRNREELEKQSGSTTQTIDTEIVQRKQKVDELAVERDLNEKELEDMKKNVSSAIEKVEKAVEDRIIDLQREFLKLTSLTVKNDTIKGLAPLTRLYVRMYVIGFEDGTQHLLTPSYLPDDRFSLPLKHVPVDVPLDELIRKSISDWSKASSTFSDNFEKSIARGNMLLDPDSQKLLTDGLSRLQRRQLLEEGVREKLESLWTSYTGKCPNCGINTGVDVKYCPECGAALS